MSGPRRSKLGEGISEQAAIRQSGVVVEGTGSAVRGSQPLRFTVWSRQALVSERRLRDGQANGSWGGKRTLDGAAQSVVAQ